MRPESIRTRTIIVLLAISLLIMLVLGGLWVYSTYVTMKKDISTSNLQDARLVSGYVDVFLNNIAIVEMTAAGSKDTQDAIKRNDNKYLKSVGDNIDFIIPSSDVVIILDKDGNVLYHSKGANTTEFVISGLFDKARDKNGTYVSGLYLSSTLKNYVFAVSVPVMDQGSAIGYIVTSVNPVRLNQEIQKWQLSPERDIVVVDSHGLVVSHSVQTYVQSRADLTNALPVKYVMNGTEGVVETDKTFDGQMRIVGFSPVPVSGWGAIASTPMNVIYAQIIQRITIIIVLLAGVSILIIMASYFVSRFLTNPIIELSDTMRSVSAGKYTVRAKADRKDEIGDLSRTFNLMMDDLERNVELEHAVEIAKKYQLIFDKAGDPIISVDINGKILDANHLAPKVFGYTRDELLSMSLADLIIPKERSGIQGLLKRCFVATCKIEAVNVRKDGSTFPVEISAAGTKIDDKQMMIAVIRDITDRKHAEEALRKSEEKYRVVANNTYDLEFWLSLEGRFIYISPSCDRITGYATSEFMADYELIHKIIHPDDRQIFHEHEQNVKEKLIPGELEFRIIRRDETIRWIHHVCQPVFDEQGKYLGIRGSDRDITERKLAEEALRRSEAHLAKSQEIGHLGSFEWDLLHHKDKWSEELFRIFGVKTGEVKPSFDAFLSFVHPDDREVVKKHVANAIECQKFIGGHEVRIVKPEGTIRWLIVDGQFICDKSGKPVRMFGTMLDITERKQAEEAVKKAGEQAKKEKERAIEETQRAELYLDIMGHDINNLNQTTIMNLEIIKDDPELTTDEKESIEAAFRAAIGSSAIIDNVRKLQQITTGKLEAHIVDLNDMVLDCTKEAPRPAGKTVNINYTPKPGMLVMGALLLKEVFCNLINNSIKYSGEVVTVEVLADETFIYDKKYYQITVEDNGYGIPDEVKSKLFTRFQRGTTKAHGKGLGLYIVRSLLEKFEGSVKVEDRVPGDYVRGSKFIVMIPAAEIKNE